MHITVRDLERSIAFYRDVVGLELGIDSSGSTRPTTQSQSQVSFCLEVNDMMALNVPLTFFSKKLLTAFTFLRTIQLDSPTTNVSPSKREAVLFTDYLCKSSHAQRGATHPSGAFSKKMRVENGIRLRSEDDKSLVLLLG